MHDLETIEDWCEGCGIAQDWQPVWGDAGMIGWVIEANPDDRFLLRLRFGFAPVELWKGQRYG
ncbi:hypothetical protein OKW76_00320 [Sphingomonas sp. S1-29]|uniref:hypothetical protein n=1 Tax=Sphingomonas sp. S1-29 TaxID=2991074 RepID=UPI002240B921|nr:hypothetical protein [Sphingomonas sp. S1-29]UZK69569.1 hypothetical protein OKW76_00320 [Sphingomonas sp. S1-29]